MFLIARPDLDSKGRINIFVWLCWNLLWLYKCCKVIYNKTAEWRIWVRYKISGFIRWSSNINHSILKFCYKICSHCLVKIIITLSWEDNYLFTINPQINAFASLILVIKRRNYTHLSNRKWVGTLLSVCTRVDFSIATVLICMGKWLLHKIAQIASCLPESAGDIGRMQVPFPGH